MKFFARFAWILLVKFLFVRISPPYFRISSSSFFSWLGWRLIFQFWIHMIHLLILKYFDSIVRLKWTPHRCVRFKCNFIIYLYIKKEKKLNKTEREWLPAKWFITFMILMTTNITAASFRYESNEWILFGWNIINLYFCAIIFIWIEIWLIPSILLYVFVECKMRIKGVPTIAMAHSINRNGTNNEYIQNAPF